MNSLLLEDDEVEFALLQRSELLPKRSNSRFMRALRKLGLTRSHREFVRDYARSHASATAKAYADHMRNEAERLTQYFPDDATSILDIGCGLAVLDLYLYRRLDSKPNLYLLDRTQLDNNIFYMFEEKAAFYNSLVLAEEMLIRNGVPRDKITLIEAPDDGRISLPRQSIQVVISTISWGFHYPVSTYVASVHEILVPGGTLLIDIRKGTAGRITLQDYFPTVEEVAKYEKHSTMRCIKES